MPEAFTIRFEPSGALARSDGGLDLLSLGQGTGALIESACGGQGNCGSCSVRIVEGPLPPPSESERKAFSPDELAAGWRQACQAKPVGSCSVRVPGKATGRTPSSQNASPAPVPIKAPVLSPTGRPGFWRRGRYTVGPVPEGHGLGLAVDLGTTNIAAALVDMVTGKEVASGSRLNPQASFAGEGISRLEYAMKGPGAARELQRAAVAAINELAAALTHGQAPSIAELALVGNPVMQHLLLGLPLAALAKPPHAPATLERVDMDAAELGLEVAAGARLYCPPNIAGVLGSDHVAALTEILAMALEGRWLLLDIGTNTEIALCADGRITSVSCASGPAFEAGKLMAAMAALRNSGAVDARGHLPPGRPAFRERVLPDEPGRPALPLVFTQQDVRKVQLAKAAVRTGLDLLLAQADLAEDALDWLIVAGSFGGGIDLEDAITIGLLPRLPSARMVQVGNAAAGGARRLLVCNSARAEAEGMARHVHSFDPTSHPGFQRAFITRTRF